MRQNIPSRESLKQCNDSDILVGTTLYRAEPDIVERFLKVYENVMTILFLISSAEWCLCYSARVLPVVCC